MPAEVVLAVPDWAQDVLGAGAVMALVAAVCAGVAWVAVGSRRPGLRPAPATLPAPAFDLWDWLTFMVPGEWYATHNDRYLRITWQSNTVCVVERALGFRYRDRTANGTLDLDVMTITKDSPVVRYTVARAYVLEVDGSLVVASGVPQDVTLSGGQLHTEAIQQLDAQLKTAKRVV